MGFGLLFIGYFMAMLMSINKMGVYFRFVGYCIVLFSSSKLKKYNNAFTYLSIASIIMIAFSLLLVAADVSSYLYELMIIDSNMLGDNFKTGTGYALMISELIFNAAMLFGIRAIALETEESKLSVNAVRNFVFICIYYLLNLLAYLPFEPFKDFAKYFSAPVLILNLVWIILNLILIGSCYARICDENDVDMERKPSRFAFVNKLRQQSEERRLKMEEEREEYRKLREQRRKK